MAEHGLRLEGRKVLLAKWLRDTALLMGEQSRALLAAEVAYRDEISLENYLRVAEIAGEQWPERRKELLDYNLNQDCCVLQNRGRIMSAVRKAMDQDDGDLLCASGTLKDHPRHITASLLPS